MKVSAHSSDESWFSPKRLTQLGWRVTWGSGNTLYDWDPYSTRSIGECVTLTVKSSSPFGDVSVQGNICPESLGPWSVTDGAQRRHLERHGARDRLRRRAGHAGGAQPARRPGQLPERLDAELLRPVVHLTA